MTDTAGMPEPESESLLADEVDAASHDRDLAPVDGDDVTADATTGSVASGDDTPDSDTPAGDLGAAAPFAVDGASSATGQIHVRCAHGCEITVELPNSAPRAESRMWRTLQSPVRTRKAVALILLAVLFAGFSIGRQASDYLSLGPGPAPTVTFVDAEGFGDDVGEWRYTTVRLERVQNWEYLLGKVLDDNATFIHSVPSGGDAASQAAAATDMENAKRAAWSVANTLAGRTPAAEIIGADVIEAVAGLPAADAGLMAGDRIVAIDGVDYPGAAKVAETITDGEGAPVEVTFVRDGVDKTVTIAPVEVDGSYRIGVQVTDAALLANPEADIDTSGVGGPSGGLMFTLAYLDALTAGDGTGGVRVAGTGTIGIDGTVGPVGGVAHKVRGAIDAGAEVFFVPAAEADQAKEAAHGNIDVVPVETARDAIVWLCDHGTKGPFCKMPRAADSTTGDPSEPGAGTEPSPSTTTVPHGR